jgi:S1-C subfamily serine protease
MALIPPFFLDCIVAIGLIANDGSHHWLASGFLYGSFQEKKSETENYYHVYLVTNRHVVEQLGKRMILRFNPEGDEAAREIPIDLNGPDGSPVWIGHPNPKIDVAVIPLNAKRLREEKIRFHYFQSDAHVMDKKKASELGLTEGDGVFVLGFPLGLVGGSRNYVIVRQGTIARIRDYLMASGKEFLVDTTIFPGNSGGPVVTRPEVFSIEGTQASSSAYLLGIVQSYVPYQDVAYSKQTDRPRVIFEENSGLASIVPIDYAQEIIEQYVKTKKTPATESGALSKDVTSPGNPQ